VTWEVASKVVHQKERYHQVTVQYQVSAERMVVAAALTELGAAVMVAEAVS